VVSWPGPGCRAAKSTIGSKPPTTWSVALTTKSIASTTWALSKAARAPSASSGAAPFASA
jgi:hypothetical protein